LGEQAEKMMQRERSKKLFERALELIPGGVNSPVRAFKAVGGNPLFIKKAAGAYLYDEDGNQLIDTINSWGPMILGHAHPLILEAVQKASLDSLSFGAPTYKEIEMAELIIDMVPSVEKVRMVNSGTEATMSALRVARGFTGRTKMIKFEGCYHGHGDSFLIAAGSGAITFGEPNSPGVTEGVAQDTLTAVFNNIESVNALFEANPNQIACVIIEPVAGNMGCVLPQNDFLKKLRALCDKHGALLIFDEVMTGFRLAKGGAQEVYGVKPDLSTFGKIIGGGMPVGAYGGKKEVMNCVSPAGPVYQAGTLSGNPIAMSAGLAMLSTLNNNPSIYSDLAQRTADIVAEIKQGLNANGINYTINQLGSMYNLFFTQQAVNNFDDAKTSKLTHFGLFFNKMLDKGVYLPPSQFETLFISQSIDKKIGSHIAQATIASILEIHQEI
jgi:glutamate-1-semialdehyde 2,1-aminomutase